MELTPQGERRMKQLGLLLSVVDKVRRQHPDIPRTSWRGLYDCVYGVIMSGVYFPTMFRVLIETMRMTVSRHTNTLAHLTLSEELEQELWQDVSAKWEHYKKSGQYKK